VSRGIGAGDADSHDADNLVFFCVCRNAKLQIVTPWAFKTPGPVWLAGLELEPHGQAGVMSVAVPLDEQEGNRFVRPLGRPNGGQCSLSAAAGRPGSVLYRSSLDFLFLPAIGR
jgi:hypothetical protein